MYMVTYFVHTLHVHFHVHVHAPEFARGHAHGRVQVHVHVHIQVHAHFYIHVHIQVHAHAHAHAHVHVHVHIHVHVLVYVRVHVNVYVLTTSPCIYMSMFMSISLAMFIGQFIRTLAFCFKVQNFSNLYLSLQTCHFGKFAEVCRIAFVGLRLKNFLAHGLRTNQKNCGSNICILTKNSQATTSGYYTCLCSYINLTITSLISFPLQT